MIKNESGLKIEKIEKCFGLSPDIIIPYYFSVVSSWPGVHLRPAVSAGLGLGTRVSNGKVRNIHLGSQPGQGTFTVMSVILNS